MLKLDDRLRIAMQAQMSAHLTAAECVIVARWLTVLRQISTGRRANPSPQDAARDALGEFLE